jgi:hypothetical protein
MNVQLHFFRRIVASAQTYKAVADEGDDVSISVSGVITQASAINLTALARVRKSMGMTLSYPYKIQAHNKLSIPGLIVVSDCKMLS